MIRTGLILSMAVMLLAGCSRQDSADEAQGAPFVRAHSIKELMATIVQPQADIFWKSAGSMSDETGDHDLAPTTEEGWLRTHSAAATVAEMGNLMMTPLYAEGRGEDWIEFSQALVKIGKRAEKAAADRNSEAILDVGGTMYNVCTACHQAYPPAAEAAADNAAAGEPQ